MYHNQYSGHNINDFSSSTHFCPVFSMTKRRCTLASHNNLSVFYARPELLTDERTCLVHYNAYFVLMCWEFLVLSVLAERQFNDIENTSIWACGGNGNISMIPLVSKHGIWCMPCSASFRQHCKETPWIELRFSKKYPQIIFIFRLVSKYCVKLYNKFKMRHHFHCRNTFRYKRKFTKFSRTEARFCI